MTEQTSKSWSVPREVDDLTLAFPAHVIGELLPEMDEIPPEFRHSSEQSEPWRQFQWRWLVGNLDETMHGVRLHPAMAEAAGFETREDLQRLTDLAFRHLGAIQGSYEPKHEHKVAGVSWLASLWFAEVIWKDEA